MIVSYKLAHQDWAVEWYTNYVDAVDASWLHSALDTLATTEGLRLSFYFSEGDYLDAVGRTFRETEFWRQYSPTYVRLYVPMLGGHVGLDIAEKEPEDVPDAEVPF